MVFNAMGNLHRWHHGDDLDNMSKSSSSHTGAAELVLLIISIAPVVAKTLDFLGNSHLSVGLGPRTSGSIIF